MSDSFTKLNYHLVFSTKNHEPWLTADVRNRLLPYMAKIINDSGSHTILINGVEDHLHILAQIPPIHAIAKIVQTAKSTTSKWFHETFQRTAFSWQAGYGAFSISPGQIDRVYRYIANQEEHHRKKTFKAEYMAMLERAGIEYEECYL